jgi:hypothetical protein
LVSERENYNGTPSESVAAQDWNLSQIKHEMSERFF